MSSQRTRTLADVQPLLTTADVARRLGATSRTVRRYARAGLLDTVRVGGLLRFRPQDVEALIEAGLTRRGGCNG